MVYSWEQQRAKGYPAFSFFWLVGGFRMFQIWLANAPGINNYAPGMPIFLVWLGTTKRLNTAPQMKKARHDSKGSLSMSMFFCSEVNYIITYTILYLLYSLHILYYIVMIIYICIYMYPLF